MPLLLLLAALVAGCGQTGDLYLPDPAPTVEGENPDTRTRRPAEETP